jgi:hypothetical protein
MNQGTDLDQANLHTTALCSPVVNFVASANDTTCATLRSYTMPGQFVALKLPNGTVADRLFRCGHNSHQHATQQRMHSGDFDETGTQSVTTVRMCRRAVFRVAWRQHPTSHDAIPPTLTRPLQRYVLRVAGKSSYRHAGCVRQAVS